MSDLFVNVVGILISKDEMRGDKGWFAVEKRSFEIFVEEVGGRLRGVIVERSRGVLSWIHFGLQGLENLL